MQKATPAPTSPTTEDQSVQGPRHFLDIDSLPPATLRAILDDALAMKQARGTLADGRERCPNARLAMIFEKPSTRTRVSFEVGIQELGGTATILNHGDMQLGRGETIADTAKVLSRYVNAIMLRCGAHETLTELAENADIPVINGLTALSHPCQIMADILTFEEHKGPIAGKTIAWIGDANNVAVSWAHAAARFGFKLKLAAPEAFGPSQALIDFVNAESADVSFTTDPEEAAKDADCIVTDVWVSMGDEDAEQRIAALRPFQVNPSLMKIAKPDAIFMHCLPAHRGDEVTAEVIDGPQSVVWDEAENRLHAQKAILAWCLAGQGQAGER
ncbi:ornithine carbamoyltransferase [Methyloligella sp. 2.7D]|uniref:ornithine carbamoyltransferase n=1 Tax=unclassified Methyloligella TaxID=2625955 RepID=UPI00157D6AF7|nr:ornithine carbamoyltransferase [Methyloligella sp. GL2]QKP78504.1 ornithine carbamoyltransferase [Methyloligella sp. GL2]